MKLFSGAVPQANLIFRKERGASLVEHSLLVALIALVSIAGVRATGQGLSANFDQINSDFSAGTDDLGPPEASPGGGEAGGGDEGEEGDTGGGDGGEEGDAGGGDSPLGDSGTPPGDQGSDGEEGDNGGGDSPPPPDLPPE